MPLNYTKKTEIAKATKHAFDLAIMLGSYTAAEDENRWASEAATISIDKVTQESSRVRSPHIISQHQVLQSISILQNPQARHLDAILHLLRNIAPLQGLGEAPRIQMTAMNEGRGSKVPYLKFEIERIPIYQGSQHNELVRDLYSFMRIHENLDMSDILEPWHLISEGQSPMPHVYILADSEQNALLRFAACSPDVRKAMRQGTALRCVRTKEKTDPALLDMIDRRTRKSPTEPREWAVKK
jgi:hypothetical protein